MEAVIRVFERVIVISLIGMMMIVILATTFELGRLIFTSILQINPYVFDINNLLEIFGFFLLILIGVELLETIKAYLSAHIIRVEVVLEVALIAIARKVIIVDVKEFPSLTLIGISALVLAIAVAFYLEKRARCLYMRQSKDKPAAAGEMPESVLD